MPIFYRHFCISSQTIIYYKGRHHFGQITNGSKKFINEKEAEYYTEKGKRAIELGDTEELKRCVHNLLLLLPSDTYDGPKNHLSGISR